MSNRSPRCLAITARARFFRTEEMRFDGRCYEECHMEVDRSRGRSSSVCLTFVSQRAEDQTQDAHSPRLIQWFVAAAAFR
jgi:hypothetical protein